MWLPASLQIHVFGSIHCLHLVPWEQCSAYPSTDMLHYCILLFSRMGFSAYCYQTTVFISRTSITLASLKPFLCPPGQN